MGQTIQVSECHSTDSRHARVFKPKMRQVVNVGELHLSGQFINIEVTLLVKPLAVRFTTDIAKDKRQHVMNRDEALHPTKFIKARRCAHAVVTKEIKHLIDFLGQWHDNGWVHDCMSG